MMNKVMRASLLLGSVGSRRMPTMMMAAATQQMRIVSYPSRDFHAGGPPGHTHEEEDDGKESHSDFKAKAKKGPLSEDELNKQFTEWITTNDVVLFMKGSKKMPRCGFSNYAV